MVGPGLGCCDGVGDFEGPKVGKTEGIFVGESEGLFEGALLGEIVGLAEGALVGGPERQMPVVTQRALI